MKFEVILVFVISFLIILNSALASTCARGDFIMGATSFVVYSSEYETAILKDNGFNWLRVLFNDETYAGNGLCGGDYNDDGKEDHIDCLIVIEKEARNEAYWNFDYDILLGFYENYTYRKAELKEVAKKVVTDMRNYSKYKNQTDGTELISTRPWPYIGFYEIGGELDIGGFAGTSREDWTAQAPLLKAAIDGVKEADPNAKILLHLANSYDANLVENFLNTMKIYGVNFDYLGFTYYPSAYVEWNNNNLINCVNKATAYGKKVIIVEFGFPTSYWCEKCTNGPEYASDNCICTDIPKYHNYCGFFGYDAIDVIEGGVTYTLTEQGQASYLEYELNFLKNNPNILGLVYSLPLEPEGWCGWPGAFNRPDATLKPGIDKIENFMSIECPSSCSYDSECIATSVCDTSNHNCLWCWYEHNAKIVGGTTICESDCGASPECDERQIWSTFCVDNIKKICDGTCNSVPLEYCRTDAYDSDGTNYKTYGYCIDYQGCSGGNCISTRYNDQCQGDYVKEAVVSGSSCTYLPLYNCKNYGSYYICSGGRCVSTTTTTIPPSWGGGCPTLFVYDGNEYLKVRKSNIHSQRGIDIVDDITLNELTVVDGYYLLSLKETTLPEHSYIDSVKLFINDQEVQLISAKHSRYGDVTQALANSDDVRTDTKVFDSIELKFLAPGLDGEAEFIFIIEGYNPAPVLGYWRNFPVKLDVSQFIPIAIVVTLVIIVLIFWLMKFFAKKK